MAYNYSEDFDLRGIITHDKIASIAREVLDRIPEDDLSDLDHNKKITFIYVDNCLTHPLFLTPPTSGDLLSVWLIILETGFAKRKEHEIAYTIAHELAHAFLGHLPFAKNEKEAVDRERAADKKVIEWGFENELNKTSYNYLYGNGVKNQWSN